MSQKWKISYITKKIILIYHIILTLYIKNEKINIIFLKEEDYIYFWYACIEGQLYTSNKRDIPTDEKEFVPNFCANIPPNKKNVIIVIYARAEPTSYFKSICLVFFFILCKLCFIKILTFHGGLISSDTITGTNNNRSFLLLEGYMYCRWHNNTSL